MLDYSADTGIFCYRPRPVRAGTKLARADKIWNARFAGRVAGSLNSRGYRLIGIDGKQYRAHRLAWLWMFEEWPAGGLDHADLSPDHNWIDNLQPATPSENNANQRCRRGTRSGRKGVSLYQPKPKWQARIYKNGKCFFLGYFDTPEAAHAAYCAKGKELFGKFFRAG